MAAINDHENTLIVLFFLYIKTSDLTIYIYILNFTMHFCRYVIFNVPPAHPCLKTQASVFTM